MKSYIIGIAGELGSGKDTLASMINYIVAVGTNKAKYTDWLSHKVKYDKTYEDRITHFADPMKDCLSIMYNIPREYFDLREYKDNLWYCITERRFIKDGEQKLFGYVGITIESFKDGKYTLNYIISDIINKGKHPVIKLRTLMQYFGTQIGRGMLGDNLWVDATIGVAASIAQSRRLCIIPDVRFINEHKAICGHSLYGGDVLIVRDNNNQGGHESETIDFKSKVIIDNNGTKLQLFFKAVNYVADIVKV